MKSVLFYGPKDIRYEEVETTEIKDGEIKVAIQVALTGGTDLKTYERGHPKIIKSIPSAFGYEFAGKVIASKNKKFKTGDRVISANTAPCMKCFFCTKQEFELCENLDFLNGSFAEEIIIPAAIVNKNTYLIPENLDYKIAASTQTLAVCLQGFHKKPIAEDSLILVYGIGAIGLSFIKLCKYLLPKSRIIAVGSSSLKKNLAIKNGAEKVLDYKTDDLNKAVNTINAYGPDYIFECTGKPAAWSQSLSLVRPGGTVNFFGGCPKGSTIELDTFKMHYHELNLIASFHHQPRYIAQALDLLGSGKIDLRDLISLEMPLARLEEALNLMKSGEVIKVAMKP